MKPQSTIQALTFNQRYIYNYFVHHRRKHKYAPCFLPKSPRSEDKLHYYLKALDKLEQHGYLSVDRTAANYQAWILKEPTTPTETPCLTKEMSTPIWR